MYANNFFTSPYNNQNNIDRINAQISDLEKLKAQLQKPVQPTSLTQNFQLAPNIESMKYANSINDVEKESITNDTPFFSRDLSVVWIKNLKGEIRTFELNEIVVKDDKDLQIEFLQAQINELKRGMINNAQYFTNDIKEQDATDTSECDATVRAATKSTKSTSVSKVSRSKKE